MYPTTNTPSRSNLIDLLRRSNSSFLLSINRSRPDHIVNLLVTDLIVQRTKCTVTKQQIDLFERQLVGLWEYKVDGRDGDDDVEGDKHKVVFPADLAERDGADLCEEGGDEPVADT